MNETVLKIALAALMHDIGKFAQGSLDVPNEYLARNESQYQPSWNGRHTHIHATYTAAFIELMKDYLPAVCNSAGWGEGDCFINLAAGHHNPETPMQRVISVADRIASGQDRATFDAGEKIAFQDVKRTRLLPVMEALGYERDIKYTAAASYKYRYPLTPLSALNIFPKEEETRSRVDAGMEYRELFNDFKKKLRHLLHVENNIELWSQHFDSLLMTYTSMMPAARVNDVIHDISLYDHCRTTAAFASALYLYHHCNDTLNDTAIVDYNPKKFLLVTGDFYGIQEFIFSAGGELNKSRSKILRGRSFAVSLFSELAADMLCRNMGLSNLSVVLNAAGMFTLLAPNTPNAKEKIKEAEERINRWLFSISFGQSSLGIVQTEASQEEFIGGNFETLWNEKHQPAMERKKANKIDLNTCGGPVTGYLDQFDNKLDRPLCALCGKRPAHHEARIGETVTCRICRDHIMIGTFLVKGERLAIFTDKRVPARGKSLLEPIFGEYQLSFSKTVQGNPLKLFDLQIGKDGCMPEGATLRLINGHVPVYNEYDREDVRLKEDEEQPIVKGEPVTFDHIASRAKKIRSDGRQKGIAALGVLKADVDNLGILMATGLSKKLFTFSRLATISRQLNSFFTIYLPFLLKNNVKFKDVYTVFAGGDDLFLIGPWRIMAELSLEVRKKFSEYVCYNDQLTLSAGITVQKTHVPVDRLADAAEEALEQSKGAEGKNSISMFGATVKWNEFETLYNHKSIMERWIEDGLVGKGMMYRFNQLVELVQQERSLGKGSVSLTDMECLKWRSKFQYSVARNIDRNRKGEERQAAINQVSEMAKWLTLHGEAVRIPLWQLLYEDR